MSRNDSLRLARDLYEGQPGPRKIAIYNGATIDEDYEGTWVQAWVLIPKNYPRATPEERSA